MPGSRSSVTLGFTAEITESGVRISPPKVVSPISAISAVHE